MKGFLFLFLLLQGCTTMYETRYNVGLYHQFRGTAEGNSPIGLIEVDQQLSNDFGCKYVHKSYLTEGTPFNNRYEDTFDAIGCYWRIK